MHCPCFNIILMRKINLSVLNGLAEHMEHSLNICSKVMFTQSWTHTTVFYLVYWLISQLDQGKLWLWTNPAPASTTRKQYKTCLF